jgi:hypothetical protein
VLPSTSTTFSVSCQRRRPSQEKKKKPKKTHKNTLLFCSLISLLFMQRKCFFLFLFLLLLRTRLVSRMHTHVNASVAFLVHLRRLTQQGRGKTKTTTTTKKNTNETREVDLPPLAESCTIPEVCCGSTTSRALLSSPLSLFATCVDVTVIRSDQYNAFAQNGEGDGEEGGCWTAAETDEHTRQHEEIVGSFFFFSYVY